MFFYYPCMPHSTWKEVNTTNTRIRKLRKALDLTQQEFADRIGVKRGTVATYERGNSVPSDAAVNLICREFNVNETWLRTGSGEMFRELSREQELAVFFDDVLRDESDNFRKRFISMLSKLDTSDWAELERMAAKLAQPPAAKPSEPPPWYPWDIDAQPPPRVPPGYASRAELEREVDQEVERYRQQLLSEKQRASQALSAKESGAG